MEISIKKIAAPHIEAASISYGFLELISSDGAKSPLDSPLRRNVYPSLHTLHSTYFASALAFPLMSPRRFIKFYPDHLLADLKSITAFVASENGTPGCISRTAQDTSGVLAKSNRYHIQRGLKLEQVSN